VAVRGYSVDCGVGSVGAGVMGGWGVGYWGLVWGEAGRLGRCTPYLAHKRAVPKGRTGWV